MAVWESVLSLREAPARRNASDDGGSMSPGQLCLTLLSLAVGRSCKCWVKPASADCALPLEDAQMTSLPPPPALLVSKSSQLILPSADHLQFLNSVS